MNGREKLALLAVVGCAMLAAPGCDRGDDTQDQNADPFMIVEPEVEQDMQDPPEEDMAPDMSGDEEDMPPIVADMGEPEPDMEEPEPPVEVLREVVDRRLFGEMSVDNRVKDPRFKTLNTAYVWYATFGAQSYQPRTIYRKVFPNTPMQAPVMHVPKDDGGQTRVYGEVNLKATPTHYSVWIGRPTVSFSGDQVDPFVSVYGVNTKNPRDFNGITLEKVEDSEVVHGNIRWHRYEAFASDLAGYGYMIVDDSSVRALYVHAPQAAPTPVGANALLGSMQRSVPASEQEALRGIFGFIREQRERQVPNERPVPHPF